VSVRKLRYYLNRLLPYHSLRLTRRVLSFLGSMRREGAADAKRAAAKDRREINTDSSRQCGVGIETVSGNLLIPARSDHPHKYLNFQPCSWWVPGGDFSSGLGRSSASNLVIGRPLSGHNGNAGLSRLPTVLELARLLVISAFIGTDPGALVRSALGTVKCRHSDEG
jgi:hypothetical protein